MSKWHQRTAGFKEKTAEALKGGGTVGSRRGVHPTMIHLWKRALHKGATGVF